MNPYGQPNYQPPQRFQPPRPMYPPPPAYGPPAGYLAPEPPSGATAVTAGILGLILGLLGVIGAFIAIINSSHAPGDSRWAIQTAGAISGGVALLWVLGALLLFARKTAGRALLMAVSVLGVVGGLVSTVGYSPIIGVATLGLSGAILGLTAATPTGRWIAARRQPSSSPYPPPYGSY
ncbi:hypothetical protein [Nocardia arthritidis]|uniref:Uncharacterized protein n=1 Tax=Nocardia arthritidis TaxID=228602 RepID=A0A6G9Y9K9_9NOCA|nr:hypothetical protein [Nocardia arthritidis]QIS09733.1 hypothetical protein F5544_09160 [Nocardia arthritidis]